MVLTRSQYENMSKEELIQELTDIYSSFANDINAKLTDLSERFNEFTSKYDKVYSELQQCKSFNYHLLTRTIQLKRNAVTNSQYSRIETIELNPVPEDLHTCHSMERTDRVIVKFKYPKQKQSLICKRKNVGTKSQELTNLNISGRLFVSESMSNKTSILFINVYSSRVPGRYILPASSTML